MIKAFIMWLIEGLIGMAMLGFLLVVVLDYTAGCGQTYIDAKGNTHPMAKNSECLFIKHNER